MRLNDGLPVWHASVSIQDRFGNKVVDDRVEQKAIELINGVGRTDGEWWVYTKGKVGHLRIGLTQKEVDSIWPEGSCPRATADAGESGPFRLRTIRRADR